MPRRTRDRKRRRVEVWTQRQREYEIALLVGELRMLWRQHGAAICAAGEGVEYVDPKLMRKSAGSL
ncbi:MAG: hypothetical protein ACREBC_13340 [Pyrinomonadaceae bacterium]